MLVLRTILLSAALLVLAAPAATATPTKKQTPAERMVAKINDVRAKHGLQPLRTARRLARSSHGHARHLVRTGTFAHGSAYARAGFRRSGEIIARNRDWRRRAMPIVRMWLRSSGHRALLLSPSFRYVGATPARGHHGGARATVWVVHFGAH